MGDASAAVSSVQMQSECSAVKTEFTCNPGKDQKKGLHRNWIYFCLKFQDLALTFWCRPKKRSSPQIDTIFKQNFEFFGIASHFFVKTSRKHSLGLRVTKSRWENAEFPWGMLNLNVGVLILIGECVPARLLYNLITA